jgi:polyisoprenoid-binding protein YceI
VRYRVDEVLFGANVTAVGETNAVTGSLDIAGTQVADATFEVDMATVESDRSQRDGQFRGRIMDVETFPTSTFTLTQPIELASVPADGEQVTATATGDLTLRGVTNTVTFDVTAQLEGDRIGVLGSIPIVFEDYDIPNPSFGGIETEDNGVLEFVLVFQRA